MVILMVIFHVTLQEFFFWGGWGSPMQEVFKFICRANKPCEETTFGGVCGLCLELEILPTPS